MPTLKESFFQVGRSDVIVLLGYGHELPVFSRARALWDFYLSHFVNLTYFVCRNTDELMVGEIFFNGHDLLVGTGNASKNTNQEVKYAATGVWAPSENFSQVSGQLAVYEYLLRRFDKPFYVCHSTITSVVDFRALFSLIESLPGSGVFGGMPAKITTPGDYCDLTIACGTNCMFTRDVIEVILDRFDPLSRHNAFPQDVNVSYLLKDINRTPLPFFSFVKPRRPETDLGGIGDITRSMLDVGHYHFRVKTSSEQMQMGRREDVDPWIMLEVMRAILGYQPDPTAAVNLKQRMIRSLGTASGTSMAAYENNFFSEPRDFPLTDEEAEVVFPSLRSGS